MALAAVLNSCELCSQELYLESWYAMREICAIQRNWNLHSSVLKFSFPLM